MGCVESDTTAACGFIHLYVFFDTESFDLLACGPWEF